MKHGMSFLAVTLMSCSLLSVSPAKEAAAAPDNNFLALKPEGVKNLGIQYHLVETKDFERTVFAIGNIRTIPKKPLRSK